MAPKWLPTSKVWENRNGRKFQAFNMKQMAQKSIFYNKVSRNEKNNKKYVVPKEVSV